MNSTIKKLIPVLCVIPLIAGAIGYAVSGVMITDSLYAAFALYFTNPVSDAYNGYIEFARWTAPLVTATAILCVLRSVWNNITWWFKCLWKDSVAVYSDEEIKIRFDKNVKAVYPGENFKSLAKSHIILFSSDQKSLKFYENNRDRIKGKNVYIGLRELEAGLIKEVDNATLFDINGSIARMLWKEIKLWDNRKENIRIVVYGNSLLAQNILSSGLLLNLFSVKQKIAYHVISEKSQFQIRHPKLRLMNHDKIIYHSGLNQDVWNIVKTADIVVIADVVSADMLQTFLVNSSAGKMYYYSPTEGDVGDFIAFRNPIAFGRDKDIFTSENICKKKLIAAASDLNEQYAAQYGGEQDWNKLSGFLKSSNISSADYREIIASLLDIVPDEELAEFEHIRWCRFHYLNYWKEGTPANGKNKDEEKRIHKDLKLYRKLSDEEKEKDQNVVKEVRKKMLNQQITEKERG